MSTPLPMPKKVPAEGFYYHYKHDPAGPVNNYAYEVTGIIFHTEAGTDDPPKPGEEHFVVYRPLYDSASVYQASLELGIPCSDGRPLEMWLSEAKPGLPRFTRITDPTTIARLQDIRRTMYR